MTNTLYKYYNKGEHMLTQERWGVNGVLELFGGLFWGRIIP